MKKHSKPNDIRIEFFSQDLQTARQILGYHTDTVEAQCAIPTGQLEQFETANKVPSLAQLRRIATFYGVKIITREPTYG